MTREQARERVLDYAYGELPADEAAVFEALLRDDPELAAALEDVRAVRRAAAELPAPELPGAVRRRILDAAGAASRRRAWAARLERLQAMFLSPAFLGAAGVVAAVVVGLHVLDPGGGDGPTSSGDRGMPVRDEAPMVATSARPSPVAEEAPASAPASAPAPVAAADEAEAAGAQRPEPERTPAASTAAGARAKSTTVAREARPSRKQEAEAVPTPDAAPGLGGLVGSGLGGGGAAATGAIGTTGATGAAPQGYGRAGLAKRAAGAAPAATPATAPVDDVATRVEAAEAEAAAPRRTAATLADGDGAFATPPPAAAKAMAAQVPAEDADRVNTAAESAESAESAGAAASDPAGLLAEARSARARGRPADALSLCRQALALAPTGGLLVDLLAEAAELALFLSRDDEARGYLDRLERLPGGAERARAIRDR